MTNIKIPEKAILVLNCKSCANHVACTNQIQTSGLHIDSIGANHPAAVGSIFGVPKENYFDDAEIYRQRWLEEKWSEASKC